MNWILKILSFSTALGATDGTESTPAENSNPAPRETPKEIAEYEDTHGRCRKIQALLSENTYLQGIALMEQKKYLPALKEFDKLLIREPENALLHLQKGVCLTHLQDYEGARMSLYRALDLDPENYDATKNLAVCHHHLHLFPDGIYWYGQAIRLNPHNIDAWEGRGDCLSSEGRKREAIDAYKKELNTIASTRDKMKAELSDLNKTPDFSPHLSKITQTNNLNEKMTRLLNYTGTYHLENGQISEAKKCFFESISLGGDTLEMMSQYNRQYIESELPFKASLWLNASTKHKQALVSAFEGLVECHIQEKQILDALNCLITIPYVDPTRKGVQERMISLMAEMNTTKAHEYRERS